MPGHAHIGHRIKKLTRQGWLISVTMHQWTMNMVLHYFKSSIIGWLRYWMIMFIAWLVKDYVNKPVNV